MLLSQIRKFSENHFPGVPITPNQQETIETREEVLSSDGAHDTDTRGYEVSDLEDLEFSWEDPAVDVGNVYRRGNDTPFSPSIFDIFQMESTAAKPITVEDEEDKEKLAPTTTTPESERPTEHPRLLKSRALGTRQENVPDSVYRTLSR